MFFTEVTDFDNEHKFTLDVKCVFLRDTKLYYYIICILYAYIYIYIWACLNIICGGGGGGMKKRLGTTAVVDMNLSVKKVDALF